MQKAALSTASKAVASSPYTSPSFKVLITGATGMVGTALRHSLGTPKLSNNFHPDVYTLKRGDPENDNEIFWDPYEMRIDLEKLEGMDAVVHLAGENVGSGEGLLAFTGRWTERKRHHIMESRRRGTQLISNALASLNNKPEVLISMSGTGYYGDGGDSILDESAPWGGGAGKRGEFLCDVARVWEEETAPAKEAGIRVVNTRMGVVLTNRGGALAKLLPPFWLGLGGVIGSGSQYMSWLTLDDAVRSLEYIMHRPELEGPVNLCSPNPVTNTELVKTLGSVLRRPTIFPMPEAVVKTAFGQMGEETLLISQRAVPKKLTDSGFRFLHGDIRSGLEAGTSSTHNEVY